MNHAWFNGHVPTKEEVQAEFYERNKKVMEEKQAEQAQKAQEKAMKMKL